MAVSAHALLNVAKMAKNVVKLTNITFSRKLGKMKLI